jgi:hypothetical protein
MKLGRIVIDIGYIVDLDNEDMVWHAKDAMMEDISNIYKYDEFADWMQIEDAPEDATEEDIPAFLTEMLEDDEDEEEWEDDEE